MRKNRSAIIVIALVTVLLAGAVVVVPSRVAPAQVASPQASPQGSPVADESIDPAQATIAALSTRLASTSGTATAQAADQATIAVLSTQVAAVEQTSTAAAATATSTPTPLATSTPIPTATPTPTPAPAGTVLYQADTSGGFEQWDLSRGWQVFEGMLVSDGSGGSQMSPYAAPATNYAVEAEIKVEQANSNHEKSFGISLRDGAIQGFVGANVFSDTVNVVMLYIGDELVFREYITTMTTYYDLDWHTYRLEIKGNKLSLLINGNPMAVVTDNRLLKDGGGQTGLWTESAAQISVRSFRAIAL